MAAKEIRNCCSMLFLLVIVGVDGTWNISREEDMELERQLKILNKPAITTIRTDYGDVFDCVDINKQPSLDHPLLKNHKVQMRPKTFPTAMRDESLNADHESSSILESPAVGLTKGCPPGTVPIRRTRKEDLIGAKAFSKIYAQKHATKFHKLYPGNPGYHIASKRTKVTGGSNYYGAQAKLNLYNPAVPWGQQLSSEILSLINDDGPETNSICVGWMVYPILFGDNHTRLYTSWTADGFRKTGCANTYCLGFVQVSPQIPLGLTFPYVSTYNGEQFDMKFTVHKDVTKGHWWLRLKRDDTVVGYWPKSLFNTLSTHASGIGWGGDVYSPLYSLTSPPMGSGHMYEPGEGFGGFGKSCYARNIMVQTDLAAQFVDIDPKMVETYEDNPNCYNLGADKNYGGEWGYTFFFGGQGGQCGSKIFMFISHE